MSTKESGGEASIFKGSDGRWHDWIRLDTKANGQPDGTGTPGPGARSPRWPASSKFARKPERYRGQQRHRRPMARH